MKANFPSSDAKLDAIQDLTCFISHHITLSNATTRKPCTGCFTEGFLSKLLSLFWLIIYKCCDEQLRRDQWWEITSGDDTPYTKLAADRLSKEGKLPDYGPDTMA